MRVKRTTYIIILFIITWATVVYFAFTNRPINIIDTNYENDIDVRLLNLEIGISEQSKLNQDMIYKLHRYLDKKKQSKEPLNDNNINNNNDINNVEPMIKRDFDGNVIPVLVFACNRISVSRCLEQLIQHRPNPDQFPIIVSQDCNHAETTEVINRYGSQVVLIKQPDQSDIEVPPKEKKFKGYFKIARHYGWALNQTFFNFNFDSVIIVEDDLDISPDFFEYFSGLHPLLKKDPTLWCISAWNDNGKSGLVNDKKPELLYRTDFFPGLGWMMTKDLWLELCNKWPKSYWDDWIRQPQQRKDRACIRPEISRTRTFGKIGVSNGLFFEKHLKYIKLNEVFVPFSKMNLSYLLKENYDTEFMRNVYQSAVVSYQELRENKIAHDGSVRIVYHTKDMYKRTAKLLGLMDDFKSGVPRTGYNGIITFHNKGRTVYLAPSNNWKGYDLTWS